MDGDTSEELQQRAMLADSADGEERSRLAARAYRPTRIDIDEALRHNWLEIWYQPKIDLRRRRLVGAEALARIRHPELGVLLPGSFLPEISETGLLRLTQHAQLAALRDWPIFDKAGFNLHLSVNVPVGALRLPIGGLIEVNRPNAEHWPGLILEVKEDEIVRDLDAAQQRAAELRVSGISISIDDFGAEYAAFSRLHEPAFAEFKIGNRFVKNCAIDPARAAICQTAIDLAHRLGSVVVAEGIGSPADLQALQRMGCDLGQGVLIAPPLPTQSFLELLHQLLSRPTLPAASADAQPSQSGRPPSIDRVA